MKTNNTAILYFLLILTAFTSFNCDDSGVTTVNQNTTFNQTNLKTLSTSDSVVYELFVNMDTTGNALFCSMGKFNINASGLPVDMSGNGMAFKFSFAPNLEVCREAFVTLEPLNDMDTLPNGIKIVASSRGIVNGVLTYNMNMEHGLVLGGIATQFKTDSARYEFLTPTDGDPITLFQRGMWYTTDPFGNNAGLTCQNLAGRFWKYHAYVIDMRDPNLSIYNVGSFQDPNGPDDYSTCNSNVAPGYNKPGQDWLVQLCPGNGVPDIDSVQGLNDGNHSAIITLEPTNRASTSTGMYNIKLFQGPIGSAGFNTYKGVDNVAATYLPTVTLTITKSSGQ